MTQSGLSEPKTLGPFWKIFLQIQLQRCFRSKFIASLIFLFKIDGLCQEFGPVFKRDLIQLTSVICWPCRNIWGETFLWENALEDCGGNWKKPTFWVVFYYSHWKWIGLGSIPSGMGLNGTEASSALLDPNLLWSRFSYSSQFAPERAATLIHLFCI